MLSLLTLTTYQNMPIKKKGPGAPPGTINNPVGKNQFAGDKGKTIAFRLPIELDEAFRTITAAKGINSTQGMTEAVALWVKTIEAAEPPSLD
jgi:hypothetical protein